jgi:hypothetical protein
MQGIVISIGILGLCVLFALGVVATTRRVLHGRVREGHNDVLVPLFLTAGTLYAVLLGFLVIAVWESFGEASNNASEEASTLTTLYRQTNGMPTAERTEMRKLLREYNELVITDEWKIQAATGGGSTKARKAIGELYRAYSVMSREEANSSINVEFLNTLRTVANDRNRRALQASEHLPSVLWVELLFGGAVVVGMSALLYMELRWAQMLATSLMAALIGTLLLVTLLLNTPFKGPLALAPEGFEHSTTVFDSVDAGN